MSVDTRRRSSLFLVARMETEARTALRGVGIETLFFSPKAKIVSFTTPGPTRIAGYARGRERDP